MSRGDGVGRLTHALAALVAAAAVAACTKPLESFPEPLPGTMHIESDPARAPVSTSLRYLLPGGDISRVRDNFAGGQKIQVTRSSLPGEHGVEFNGQRCNGRFTISARVETDVLLILRRGECQLKVVGTHREDEPHPPSSSAP